jgi:hypothetical protein
VNSFAQNNLNRNTPKKLAIDDLFYLYDAELEGHKPFYPEVFIEYYQSLSSNSKLNLRYLFDCINQNEFIKTEFKYYKMNFSLYNAGLKTAVHFKLPHNSFFRNFFVDYVNSDISCKVTFDEILSFLKLNYKHLIS